ncbi:MAG: hypothetical protein ACTS9Y_01325 [Methylophilus sp.]|uniref:hypothetical protein n=1 Tax=Methylophilus sp. TaxID=29541 RepID=UPI003F9FDEAF
MKQNNKKTIVESGWMVEFYSGVAVHESGFSVFITDSYNHVSSQFFEHTTNSYLTKHGITLEDLYYAGKEILVQSLVNKAHRLEISMSVIRHTQSKSRNLAKG